MLEQAGGKHNSEKPPKGQESVGNASFAAFD